MESTGAHDRTPNWLAFEASLQEIGLRSIEGLPEDLFEWLRLESRGSELLNVDDEQDAFIEDFQESPRLAVMLVFEKFEKNSIGKSEKRKFVQQSDFRRQRSQSQQLALSGVGEKKCVCFCLIEFHHDCRR